MSSCQPLRMLIARTASLSLRSAAMPPKNCLNTFATAASRVFSSQPAKKENPRLRTHAVSLYHGDYSDDGVSGAWEDEDKEDSYGWEENKDHAELAGLVKKEQTEMDEKKKRWAENSKPIVRVPNIDNRGRSYGRGGRKTSAARVWIYPGFGNVVVNRKELTEYFPRATHRESILSPFVATLTCGHFDVQCHVEGGGMSGQAGAIRHGLARALNEFNPDAYRIPLKRLGYLTRDARMVERKKVGKVKARKSPQWSRR